MELNELKLLLDVNTIISKSELIFKYITPEFISNNSTQNIVSFIGEVRDKKVSCVKNQMFTEAATFRDIEIHITLLLKSNQK